MPRFYVLGSKKRTAPRIDQLTERGWRVDKHHPLAPDGLCYIPGVDMRCCLVSGAVSTNAYPATDFVGQWGRAVRAYSGAVEVSFPSAAYFGLHTGAAQFSIFGLTRHDDGGATHYNSLSSNGSGGWGITNTSTHSLKLVRAFVGYSGDFNDGTLATDVWRTFGLVWTPGGNAKGYYNAVETDLGNQTANVTDAPLVIASSNAASSRGVWTSMLLGYRRRLTALEQKLLHLRPTQFLIPAMPRTYFFFQRDPGIGVVR